jgi:hypothetical protein
MSQIQNASGNLSHKLFPLKKDKILQSEINMLCKSTKPGFTLSVIKLTTTSVSLFNQMHHFYPNAKQVNMYRNGIDIWHISASKICVQQMQRDCH